MTANVAEERSKLESDHGTRDEPVSESPSLRQRELRDPRTLRALAHPVRLRLLDELAAIGPATATDLSERIGESPANCSWHLRQLARYGFVEEAGGGSGRQRPWQVVVERTVIGPDDEPEVAQAADAVAETMDDRAFQAVRAWRGQRRSLPPQWRSASFSSHAIVWLTAEELAQIRAEFNQIWERHAHRSADLSRRPPGARPVRLLAWGFPAGPAAPSRQAPDETPDDPAGQDGD